MVDRVRRSRFALAVLVCLACEHADGPPAGEIQPRSKRASAAGLLQVELQLAALKDFIEHNPTIPSSASRLEEIRFLRAHIARCEGWLAQSDSGRQQLAAASVGLDLSGVGYDLIRNDLEATLHHLAGLVRPPTNAALKRVWHAVRALEADPASATSPETTSDLIYAEAQRDSVMTTAPGANVLRVGVVAANNTSAAYSIAKAAMAAGPMLGRIAGALAEPAGVTMGVEVTAGGAAAVSLVSSSGAIILTEVEVIALVQTGALSAAAVQLMMMANGRPPKVPDPKRFAEWVNRAPTRPPQQPDKDFSKYQVKVAGPLEKLLAASSGEKVWADGVREADCRLLETKLVGPPENSPFVNVENRIQEGIRHQVREEFARYGAVIRDPASPAIALEVITNEPRAVPFFESLLQEMGIPGEVVVRPFP
jgi:restriction endonuclease fold toxin 2 of polymorphic toxin system